MKRKIYPVQEGPSRTGGYEVGEFSPKKDVHTMDRQGTSVNSNVGKEMSII